MAVLKVNHLTGLGLQQARLIPPGERGQTAYPGIAGQSIPPQGGLVPRWVGPEVPDFAGMGDPREPSPERPLEDRSTPAASRRQNVKSGFLLAIRWPGCGQATRRRVACFTSSQARWMGSVKDQVTPERP